MIWMLWSCVFSTTNPTPLSISHEAPIVQPPGPSHQALPSWFSLRVEPEPRWTWPQEADFSAWWEPGQVDERVVETLIGDLRDPEGQMLAEVAVTKRNRESGPVFQFIYTVDDTGFRGFRSAEGRWAGEYWALVSEGDGPEYQFFPTWQSQDNPIDDEVWESWVYTSSLLSFEGPVYPEVVNQWGESSEEAERLWERAVQAEPSRLAEALVLLDTSDMSSDDGRWFQAIEMAETLDDPALTLALYARYRPVGRCSMDTRPQDLAREYAELCYSEGRLGCFVQLQVRIMGAQFSRVAWSSYGDAAHGTEVNALAGTGIQTDRFLEGLMVDFETPEERAIGLGLWRLGRALAESADSEALRTRLVTLIESPEIDSWNRFRAVVTLTAMGQSAGLELASSPVLDLEMDRFAELWIAGL
jgi:hypothetical protein